MKPSFRTFVLLLCLCALTLRLSGTHMHVAIDHDEAPHLPHMATFGSHDEHRDQHETRESDTHGHESHDMLADGHGDIHGETEHMEHGHVEVSLDGGVLSKKLGADVTPDTLFFMAILSFLLFASRKQNLPQTRQARPAARQLAYLRPPLRGPPLQACINS